ncbi:MAG: Bug family tripartite tricarboxylate transporter substrate binding protein [Xanthobacteraceae bacterium]
MLSVLKKVAALAVLVAAFALAPAKAQHEDSDYPNRTVKIVVSAPAGGGLDIAARIIADRLRQRLGPPVIVENRPGAAGNTGAEAVAMAEPDGYTLLAAQPSPLTVNQFLYKKLSFDPAAFEPVAIMTAVPNLLVVSPNLPVSTVKDFIVYAKANPGKLNFASQGTGTTPHLSAELFNRLAGTKLVHVPYKGTAQAVNDVIAGHVDLMFLEMGSAFQLYKGGRAKVLAISSRQRMSQMPEVPTFIEAGVPEFKSDTWNAIAAPPKTPAAIVAKLNAAINDVLAMPDVQAHFAAISMQPIGGTPADLARLIKTETERWADVIRAANISAN